MEESTKEKVDRLSQLEQNSHQFLTQRQNLQSQIYEIDSALKELGSSTESYKIIGNIMLSSDKNSLQEELNEEKKKLKLRIESIEKQEQKIKEKALSLQKEVMKEMEGDENATGKTK